MSDIGINLSGIIALFVFLIVAAGLGIGGLVSLVIAFIRGSGTDAGVTKHGGFAFFLAALPLIAVNLIAFGILVYFVDSNAHETNELLDRVAAYAWLPLQLILWITLGILIRKIRK